MELTISEKDYRSEVPIEVVPRQLMDYSSAETITTSSYNPQVVRTYNNKRNIGWLLTNKLLVVSYDPIVTILYPSVD